MCLINTLNKPFVLGLVSRAQGGKDEFAKVAMEEFGAGRISFGDAVKDEVAAFLVECGATFEERNLWGTGADKEEKCVINKDRWILKSFLDFCSGNPNVAHGPNSIVLSFRSIFQFWGTEYRRAQDDNYWVNKALSKCTENKLYVISDVRFLNEANAILDMSGILVRIYRPDAPVISGMNHQSETEVDKIEGFSYYLLNDCTLEEYQKKCRDTLKDIVSKYVQ